MKYQHIADLIGQEAKVLGLFFRPVNMAFGERNALLAVCVKDGCRFAPGSICYECARMRAMTTITKASTS